MHIRLEYGREGIPLTLPETATALILNTRETEAPSDTQEAVLDAISRPVGSPAASLAETARGAEQVVIVVSDITRPVPYKTLLPPILEVLTEEALVPPEGISFLVATGLHRPTTESEILEILGPEIAGAFPVYNHEARKAGRHRYIGRTPRGTPVLIDQRYLDKDFRITTSLVEPHFMAGFSGGRKALCPGLCAAKTIGGFHAAALLAQEGVETGRLDGNPVHEELLAGALLAGCEFSVNTVMDPQRRLTGVYAGALDTAHKTACEAARAAAFASVPEPVDAVVTTGGGYPLDTTFYQTVKGIVAADSIVKEGGTIIVAAECSEGLGSREFEGLVRNFRSPQELLATLKPAEEFVVDQWQLQLLMKPLERADVVLVSHELAPDAVEALGIRRSGSVEEALRDALTGLGEDAVIAVIPEGPYVLAGVTGEFPRRL